MIGPQSEARQAANQFRATQHLGAAPIADLVTVLEDVPGVHVAVLPVAGNDHHGMRGGDPNRHVTVLGAAATAHPVRLRSTLAHELGHHVFGDPTPLKWSDKTPEEVRATEFARHLLVPIEGLVELLGEPGHVEVTEPLLSKVVERFAVSPQMAAIQLREAGFISRTVADRYMSVSSRALATRYGWTALYQQWSVDSQVVRPPRQIVASGINAFIGGHATVETLANLQDTTTDAVRANLDEAGIAPAPPEPVETVEDTLDWASLGSEDPAGG